MAIQRFKLCLDNLVQGGETCKNPTILWQGLGFLEFNCLDPNCNCAEVQIPEGATEKCFNVIIDCQEECDKCPTQVIRRCLCDKNSDCGECEICGPDGICISRCPSGKVCKDDICVGCKDSSDCPDGKICVGGECVCPPGTPYTLPFGRCGECLSDEHCPPCTRCVDGTCVPIDCGTGVCDPKKNDCVECTSSGDCGTNECCIGNKCECCDGFEYNPITGECDPIGQCTTDEECPECYICVGDECIPRVCPTGYICIDDECRKVCECEAGPCSKTEACIPYNGEICYCEPCSGSCTDNGDCGYGCYCDNGNCKPNPCSSVACGTSVDCGEGCGCYNGVCTPCISLNCTNDECDDVEGCKCFGQKCKQDPCSGPCDNGADCGDGCGCLDGVCVSCDKLSCVGTECADVLGCTCIANNCVDKQGCDGGCSVSTDCPVGCTCYQGECVPCEDFPCDECSEHDGCACLSTTCVGDGTNDCDEDDITITREASCTLKGTVENDYCCTCETIDAIVEQTKTNSKLVYSIGLYKGGVKLSDLPVENESEYVGQYKLVVRFDNSTPIVKYVTVTSATPNKDSITFPEVAIPSNYSIFKATVEISNSLEFENNCVYEKRQIGEFYITNSMQLTAHLDSDSCRAPIFTWYKSSTTSFTNNEIFRQRYVDLSSPMVYTDILTADDGLRSGYYYQLDVDCSCEKSEQYASCQDPGKLYFCDPVEFNYTVSDCNKRILFDEVRQCATNALGGVQWELYIKTAAAPNYTLYATYTSALPAGPPYPANVILIPAGTIITTPSAISGIKFVIKGDPCTDCAIEELLEQSELCCANANTMTIAADCGSDGVEITVENSVSNPVSGCIVNMYQSGVLVASTATDVSGVAAFVNLNQNETYEFDLDVACDVDNCIEPVSYTHECVDCPTKSVTANYNVFSDILNITLSSIDVGNTYTYKVDGNTFTPNPSAIALSNGVHTVVVTETYPDESVCTYSAQFYVNNCASVVLTATYAWDQPTQLLEITAISGGTAPYTVSFNGQNFSGVPITGIDVSTVGMADGSFPLVITDSDGCSNTYQVVIDNCSQFEGNGVVDCEAGEITLIFNNGSGPFQYQLKDGANNTVVAATTASTSVTVSIDPNATSGEYTLLVRDSLGCEDVDTFDVVCPCIPAPSVDIARVQVAPTAAPNEYEIDITLGSFLNIAWPISITLYEELCEDTPTTPFVVIGDTYQESDLSAGQLDMDTFVITSPPDPSQVALIITDANGCTVCRNVTLLV